MIKMKYKNKRGGKSSVIVGRLVRIQLCAKGCERLGAVSTVMLARDEVIEAAPLES